MIDTERLMQDLHEANYSGRPMAVLMGDDDYVAMIKEWKESGAMNYPAPNNIPTQYMGHDILTNHTPGTKGWIIGEKLDIYRMRDAIYMSNYRLVFHDSDKLERRFGLFREDGDARTPEEKAFLRDPLTIAYYRKLAGFDDY